MKPNSLAMNSKLSGNEVYCTNALLLLKTIMLRSNLHYQKVRTGTIFLYDMIMVQAAVQYTEARTTVCRGTLLGRNSSPHRTTKALGIGLLKGPRVGGF